MKKKSKKKKKAFLERMEEALANDLFYNPMSNIQSERQHCNLCVEKADERNDEALPLDVLYYLMEGRKKVPSSVLRRCVRQFQRRPETCKDKYLRKLFHELFSLWAEEFEKWSLENSKELFSVSKNSHYALSV